MYKEKGQKHCIQQMEIKMHVKCELQPKAERKTIWAWKSRKVNQGCGFEQDLERQVKHT